MIKFFHSFVMMLKQLLKDYINIGLIFMPILCGLIFRLLIPYLDTIISVKTGSTILYNYYLLFDVTLSILTPFMICFTASMIVLEDIDDGIAKYEVVTPLGKSGYLISRLIIPAIISFIYNIILLAIFKLSGLGFLTIVVISFFSSVFALIYVMIIVSLSNNRVEGMAIAKIANMIMIGAYVPFFIKSNVQYLFSFMPSLWITKIAEDISIIPIVAGLITTALWVALLYRKFNSKLLK